MACTLGLGLATALAVAPAWAAPEPVGCFKDSPDRALDGLSFSSSSMTRDECNRACQGFEFFGLQYYQECWCGNGEYGRFGASTDCNAPCTGDGGQVCGGGWANSVYATDQTEGFEYIGCYEDQGVRAMQLALMRDGNSLNAASTCNRLCQEYKYFSMENGNECRCGNSYDKYGSCAGKSCQCNTKCPGEANGRFCGGGWAMSVYHTQLQEEVFEPLDGATPHVYPIYPAETAEGVRSYLQATLNCRGSVTQECPAVTAGQQMVLEWADRDVTDSNRAPLRFGFARSDGGTSCLTDGTQVMMHSVWQGVANAWLRTGCGTPKPCGGGQAVGLTPDPSQATTYVLKLPGQAAGTCLSVGAGMQFELQSQDGQKALSDCGDHAAKGNCMSGFSMEPVAQATKFAAMSALAEQRVAAPQQTWPLVWVLAGLAAVVAAALAWRRAQGWLGRRGYKQLAATPSERAPLVRYV